MQISTMDLIQLLSQNKILLLEDTRFGNVGVIWMLLTNDIASHGMWLPLTYTDNTVRYLEGISRLPYDTIDRCLQITISDFHVIAIDKE